MIYLQEEVEGFERTKNEFEANYKTLLLRMLETFTRKGATRDTNSPIHHRMSPATMIALAQAKMRRIETIISTPKWEKDMALLNKVIEECGDVANYNLFVAALCMMLEKENLS